MQASQISDSRASDHLIAEQRGVLAQLDTLSNGGAWSNSDAVEQLLMRYESATWATARSFMRQSA